MLVHGKIKNKRNVLDLLSLVGILSEDGENVSLAELLNWWTLHFFPKTLICKYRKKKRAPTRVCAEIKWSSSMELEKSAAFKAQLGEERESNLLLGALRSGATSWLDAPAHSSHSEAPCSRWARCCLPCWGPTCAERALGGSRAAAHRWAPLITAHSCSRRKEKNGVISAALVWRQVAGDQSKSPANTATDGRLELSALPV